VLSCGGNHPEGLLRCPLHFWTYDLDGCLVGAPRMGDQLAQLRDTVRLPPVRSEIWHGFIFVNLSGDAPPLAPSLAKVEACWAHYPEAEMVTVPRCRQQTRCRGTGRFSWRTSLTPTTPNSSTPARTTSRRACSMATGRIHRHGGRR